MATLLDRHINLVGEAMRASSHPELDDIDAAILRAQFDKSRLLKLHRLSESEVAQLIVHSCLEVFLAKEDTRSMLYPRMRQWAPPMGLKVHEGLVRGFLRSRVPKTDDFLNLIDKHNCYFDFPGRTLSITDQAFVRAVFTQPSALEGDPQICVVITNGRSNMVQGICAWWLLSGDFVKWAAPDVSEEALREPIERLLKLIALYFQERKADMPLMQKRVWRPGQTRKKQRAAAKKGTIFSILDMRPRKSDTWAGTRRGEGSKPAHETVVSGHFRWQAHGPEWKLRKLIFVDSHVRGTGDRKTPLNILA